MTLIAALPLASEAPLRELPFSPWFFGLIALAVLLSLLLITLSFNKR